MKLKHKKNSSRWDQDIYVGWVPWSLSRWWSACKIWFFLALFAGGPILFFLEGVTGVLGLIIAIIVVSAFVLFSNRKRGIGLTKNGEIVVFGPHKPLALPIVSLKTIGVLDANKLAAVHLKDPKGIVKRSSWIGKFWEMAGYQGERESYDAMMTTVATAETRMGGGRGKVFVIRDLEGFFWPVAPTTGFEVATLRDLALAAKIPFFTSQNPFNDSLRSTAAEVVPFIQKDSGKKTRSKVQSKKDNRALMNATLISEEFKILGGKKVWSPFRKNSFIKFNNRDGQEPDDFHEIRLRQMQSLAPDTKTNKDLSLKLTIRIVFGFLLLFGLLFAAPIFVMAQNPTIANGFITRSWTPAFERIWVEPPGWTIEEGSINRVADPSGVVDTATFLKKGTNEKVNVWAAYSESNDSCADSIYYGGILTEEKRTIPDFKLTEGRLHVDLDNNISYWCQQQVDARQTKVSTILYRFENVSDPLSFVKAMRTRINT